MMIVNQRIWRVLLRNTPLLFLFATGCSLQPGTPGVALFQLDPLTQNLAAFLLDFARQSLAAFLL